MQTAREKIRELRALHDDGLLSQQEFDFRKNAILDAEFPAPAGRAARPLPRQGTEIGLMAGMEVGPPDRRYRLERQIAHGGMGQVWQAVDIATHAELGHGAMVALKILPPQLTQSATRAKLLVEEATEARKLAHEHIVRVYEWARDPATASYFIIMECLEGEDLDSMLARGGPLRPARALELAEPIAGALDYAWERRRLVHRDLKPGNVFVTSSGEVKLLDFGIAARVRTSASSAAIEAPASSGTAGYRAPEAGTHQRAPERTLDVYAVAVMIYQMVEGEMPFDGARTEFHHPARPASLDEAQWAVLQAGFAWRAEDRPASVAELVKALRTAALPAPAESKPEAPGFRRLIPPACDPQAEAARVARDRGRREQEARERAERDSARRTRREALRQQLRAKRAEECEKARAAQEEEQRRAQQAKAAAAYRAEQERARAGIAARTEADQGVLRDRFLDRSGMGPQLVVVQAGRFLMGSPEHERRKAIEAGAQPEWLARETPQRWVGIGRQFALGRFPVTVGEWRRFAVATGWRPHAGADWAEPRFSQNDDHPVVGVTWGDAQNFVRWLGEQTGQHYRLPSEAEWEYACRAGTKSAFAFGDTIDTSMANYDGNYSYGGSQKGVSRHGTTPVGSFAPNGWGLYDMHGNVWEWVQDVVHDSYEGAPPDGRPWEEGGDQGRRILRGGSWLYHPRYLRSALRNGFSAVLSNDIVGFRVARELH
ncbi:bifunctional serine/threonine-protein kinase/formylglycine-generating enzyme family protein [Massilia cavernae]|uniref:Serine/threonine protein kinase n=1 Tax=Massilia cavernae TaxID=2320864 RepID=A0A418Y131_9BURK|nr:bifunctional serine/threonine-protein kinase/formylglycine-generating enzyme family protein [Massilia cavernae]RJG19187.1 serine/threonine protein kinase [Massilia cavernae]